MNIVQSQNMNAQGNNVQYSQQLTLETQQSQNGPSMIQPDRISYGRINDSNNQQNYNIQQEYIQNKNQNNQFNEQQRQSVIPQNQQPKYTNQQQSSRLEQSSSGLNQNNRVQGSVQINQNQRQSNAAPYRQEQINSIPTQEQTLYVDQPGDITPIEADRPSYALSPNHNNYNNQKPQFDQMQDDRIKKSQNPGNNRQQVIFDINTRVQAGPNQNMMSPNKKNQKIFDIPQNNNPIMNKRANNQVGIVGNQQQQPYNQQRFKGQEEQEIYCPGDLNKTLAINPNEDISIINDVGNGQQRNFSPNKNNINNNNSNNNNMFFNPQNPNPYFQDEKVKRNAHVGNFPQQFGGNTYQGQGYQGQGYQSQGYQGQGYQGQGYQGQGYSSFAGYASGQQSNAGSIHQNYAPQNFQQGNPGGRLQNGYAVNSVYAGYAQQHGQNFGYSSRQQVMYPPIITDFKNKEAVLDKELEVFFQNGLTDQDIPNKMNMIKRLVEDRLDICINTLNSIDKQKNEISQNYETINTDYILNEHIFTSKQFKQYKSSNQKMEKAIENIKSQKSQVDLNQSQIKQYIAECSPDLLQQINHEIELDNWIKMKKDELDRLKYPLSQNFSDNNVSFMNTAGFTNILLKISQFAPQGRLQAIHDQAIYAKNDELERFYELLNHLFNCEQKLSQIWVQIDSIVYKHAEQMNKTDQSLVVIGSHLSFYITVIEDSMSSLKELQSYENEYQLIQNNSAELTQSLFQKNLQFPFDKNLEQNKKFLRQIGDKKNNQIYSITRFVNYIREQQNQIHQNQIKENVPFILTTPFDWEVITLSHKSEQLKKKLDLLENLIKALFNLEFTSYKPVSVQKNLQEWLTHSQKRHPSQQESKQKFEEVQKQITELLELRDTLGMHYVQYSCPDIFQEISTEYEKLSGQIIQIQNLQAQVNRLIETPVLMKGDPSYVQAGIKAQQQLSSMNQIMITGSYSALPHIHTEENDITKRSTARIGNSLFPEDPQNSVQKSHHHSPSKYQPHNQYPYDQQHSTQEIEKFNQEVSENRSHLLQNSQRTDLSIMEKQKCMVLYDDLTLTQTRFQLFVIKTRIESLINAKHVSYEISRCLLIEQINNKNPQSGGILQYCRQLQNLKTQLKHHLGPTYATNSTYLRLEPVINVMEEVSKSYQEICENFFDHEKCKDVVQTGYSKLNDMMDEFRKRCQHIKFEHYKQNDQRLINEAIESFAKENTRMYIQKSQEDDALRNIDISYSHLMYLKNMLGLNIEEIVQFIHDKVCNGVEVRNQITVDEYFTQNGINIKNTRENIERRKENMKNLSNIKGQRNREVLDQIVVQIKHDQEHLDLSTSIVDVLIMFKISVLERLLEYLTFPPSYNIPEGQEALSLVQYIEGVRKIVEKQLDNFEDPNNVDVSLRTSQTNDFNTEDMFQRFSMKSGGLKTNQSYNEKDTDQMLSDENQAVEFKLTKMKESMTRSIKIVYFLLDFMIKQMRQFQDYEKQFQYQAQTVIILQKDGRLTYIEFFELLGQMRQRFDQFSNSLIKYIPQQVRFLVNLINSVRSKYNNYVHEVIVKKYYQSNYLQIFKIAKNVNEQFDLNSLIEQLKESIIKSQNMKVDQHLNQVKAYFQDVYKFLNDMEEIIEEVRKSIGNPQSMVNITYLAGISEIYGEDEFFFWQRFCSLIIEFFVSYEDIKKKRNNATEDQIEKIFINKIQSIIQNATGYMLSLSKEIRHHLSLLVKQEYRYYLLNAKSQQSLLLEPTSQINK